MDYPPGVVNIADFRIPGNEPKDELDSPLSSAPGSPKESPLRRSEIGAARDWGNKLTIPNIEVLPSFDEGRIMSNRTAEEDVPDDEKKFDGKDELVGKRATCIGEDEPPSLSIRDQPPRLVPKTTQSTTNPMTPIQDLKSPPKVLKQTMWETRNSASQNFVSLSSKEALESSYDQGYASDEAKIPSPFKTKRQGDTMSAEASHPDDESGKSIASAPDDEKTAQKPANSTDVPGESTSSAFNIQESIETTLTGWVSAVFGMSGSNNEPDEEEQPENPPEPELDGDQRTFAHELTNSLKASSPTADNQLTDEKEVVAIREKSSQKDFSDISDSQGFEVELDSRSHGDEAMGKPVPRRLDYGNTTGRSAKILASEELRGHESLHNQSLDVDLKEAMRRFASDTREALRKAGENDANAQVTAKNASNISNSPLRSLTIGGSTGSAMNSDTADTQKTAPVLVQTMDSELGIAKGDIMLSLLNENTKATDTSVEATWADRVHGAIWRCRRMRKSIGCFPSVTSPVPTGINKSQVAKGLKSVAAAQEVALANLAHDEIDEALELFEGIIFAYFSYFEHAQSQQGDKTDIKVYLGAALHNLGILNLLKGEYKEAFSFFTRAVDSRKASLGEGHPDHLASLAKLAICLYASNELAEAHKRLVEALEFARKSRPTEDRMQTAEILNNLGCLAYMCGQPLAAHATFLDSLEVQFAALSESLYEGSASLGHSISLNISITRSNIGFIKLVTNDLPVAVTAMENALMEQQVLLRGAHDTVIATMDHLAVANLLNGDQKRAAQMFGRILDLQQKEYGANDRRCHVTKDKIEMFQSKGTNFDQAIEELRKTFSISKIQNTGKDKTGKGRKALTLFGK